jgi:hypothetical protein
MQYRLTQLGVPVWCKQEAKGSSLNAVVGYDRMLRMRSVVAHVNSQALYL